MPSQKFEASEASGGQVLPVFKCPSCNQETTDTKSLKIGDEVIHFCKPCLKTFLNANVPSMVPVMVDDEPSE